MKRIITQAQIDKLILLSMKGYNNWQLAMECEMKHATVLFWKKKLRNQSIQLPHNSGRPLKNTNRIIKLRGKLAELKKQEIEDKNTIDNTK